MEELMDRLNQEVEKKINEIVETGIVPENIEKLYKLVDIHKDIANEKYWKEDNMRYGTYSRGSYGNDMYGRNRDSRGRYTEGYNEGNYGRKYRGEDMLNEMYEGYREYADGKNMYGADNDTLKSFEYMLKSFKDYYKHLKQEASSKEEVEMLEKTAREIGQM